MNLRYESVRVRFGGREVVRGASLLAPSGKLTGIIGPNGSGKSTLVKTVFGMVPLTGGNVFVDERNISALSARMLASLVGYVGQETVCPFDFSVSEVVSMGLYARRERNCRAEYLVDHALEELHLCHLRDRSIQALSGGERKMVFIARAVAQGADILVLDEPTNHLDIRHQLFLLEYLKRCGRTVLLVLHDLRLAAHYCDRIYMLSEGRTVAEGCPEEVMTEDRIMEVFGIWGHAVGRKGSGLDFELFSGI